MALIFVTDHILLSLGLLQPDVEFVWWWGGVCKVIFMSNPTAVLRLCCVVLGVVTKIDIISSQGIFGRLAVG